MRFTSILAISLSLTCLNCFAELQEVVVSFQVDDQALVVRDAILFSENGHITVSDFEGHATVDLAQNYYIKLTSLHFEMKYRNQEMFILWSGPGTPLSSESVFYRAIFTKNILEETQRYLVNELSHIVAPAQIRGQLRINVDVDSGCDAAYYSGQIVLHSGNETCIAPSLNKSIIIHEYAHYLQALLVTQPLAYDKDLNEGMSDIFSQVYLNSPLMGDGFYHERDISYIRNISEFFAYPGDWRGEYSGAMIVSSSFWDIFELLKASMPLKLAQKKFFEIYFLTLMQIDVSQYNDRLKLAETVAPIAESIFNGHLFARRIHEIFENHGLSARTNTLVSSVFMNTHAGETYLVIETSEGVNDAKIYLGEDVFINRTLAPGHNRFKLDEKFLSGQCGEIKRKRVKITIDGLAIYAKDISYVIGGLEELGIVELALSQEEIAMPSMGEQNYQFHISVPADTVYLEANLHIQIEHFFPDDLSIIARLGEQTYYQKGIEERQIAPLNLFVGHNEQLSLSIQDLKMGMEGTISGVSLSARSVQLACHRQM